MMVLHSLALNQPTVVEVAVKPGHHLGATNQCCEFFSHLQITSKLFFFLSSKIHSNLYYI